MLCLWSALWVAWFIAGGVSLGATAIAVLGFIGLLATSLGRGYQGRLEDWERRRREAEALEAMKREALESQEFEREVAELQQKEDRR